MKTSEPEETGTGMATPTLLVVEQKQLEAEGMLIGGQR